VRPQLLEEWASGGEAHERLPAAAVYATSEDDCGPQCIAVARLCPFTYRRSRVMSRLCACCRWAMSTTTHVLPVLGVLVRLADQAKASASVAGVLRRLARGGVDATLDLPFSRRGTCPLSGLSPGPGLSSLRWAWSRGRTSQGVGNFIRQADASGPSHSYRCKCGNPGGAD
jgi:hypothetical protein